MKKVFLSGSKIIHCAIMLLVPVLFLLHPWVAFSEEEPLDKALKTDDAVEDELKYLQEETYVITPSKIPQRIEKAPGTVHVITDRQIRQMGPDISPRWSRPFPGGLSIHGFRERPCYLSEAPLAPIVPGSFSW